MSKPSYEELEEVAALAIALLVSAQDVEEPHFLADYVSLSRTLNELHHRYRDLDWTLAIMAALERVTLREKPGLYG
jgi:hypothetical protein